MSALKKWWVVQHQTCQTPELSGVWNCNVTACNVKEVYPKRGMLSTAPDQLTFTGWTGGEKTVC